MEQRLRRGIVFAIRWKSASSQLRNGRNARWKVDDANVNLGRAKVSEANNRDYRVLDSAQHPAAAGLMFLVKLLIILSWVSL